MSNCIKDLFEYDLVKKCSNSGNISLKTNFHKDKSTKHGLKPTFKLCVKDYYSNNYAKFIRNTEDWNKNNPEKVDFHEKFFPEEENI